MHRAVFVAFLLILGSAVLGATVLREPLAWAATPFQNVIVANTADEPVPAADVDQRTAVRFGPESAFTNFSEGPLVLIPKTAIPAGKKLIVTYMNVLLTSVVDPNEFADGRCTALLLTGEGTSNTQRALGGVPLTLNDDDLNGSEMMYLPLSSGEGLGYTCTGVTAAGTRPNGIFIVNVGGYFISAS